MGMGGRPGRGGVLTLVRLTPGEQYDMIPAPKSSQVQASHRQRQMVVAVAGMATQYGSVHCKMHL